MFIRGIQQTLPGVYKITPNAGSAFFLRTYYLSHISEEFLLENIHPLDLFNPEQEDPAWHFAPETEEDILHAALVYSAECAAMNYLARQEHCRAGLKQKLVKKQITPAIIDQALDYLESINYLSDYRFAGAWLRSRSIDHKEGPSRLSAELASRGVDRQAAKQAIDEFFQDKDPLDLCRQAAQKFSIRSKQNEKKFAALLRLGFSPKDINTVLKEEL